MPSIKRHASMTTPTQEKTSYEATTACCRSTRQWGIVCLISTLLPRPLVREMQSSNLKSLKITGILISEAGRAV